MPGSGSTPTGAKLFAAECKSLATLTGQSRPAQGTATEQAHERVRRLPRASVSVLDTGRSKVHEPHPDPTLNVTCLHIVVDSSISPNNHITHLHAATSVLLCTMFHAWSGPPPTSAGRKHHTSLAVPCPFRRPFFHLVAPNPVPPFMRKPNLTCSFLAALKYATADRFPFSKAPNNWSFSTMSRKGWTSCSEALCLHHHKRDRTDSTADLAYLSASCSAFAFLTSSERPLGFQTNFNDPHRYDFLPGAPARARGKSHPSELDALARLGCTCAAS